MAEADRAPRSFPTWAGFRLVAIVLPLAAWCALAAATWMLASSWIGRPFPGFVVQANACTSVIVSREWPGVATGIHRKNHVLALDGRPIASATALYEKVAAAPPGTPFTYTYVHRDGPARTVTIRSVRFTARDLERIFLPFWIGGLLHLLVGAVVLWLRPASVPARAHWLYCQVMGMFLLTKFDRDSTFWFEPLAYLGFALFVPTILGLALVFPRDVGSRRSRRIALAAAWVVAAALAAAYVLTFRSRTWWAPASDVLVLAPALVTLGAMGFWAREAFTRAASYTARSQAGLVLVGFAVAFLPSLVYFVLEIGGWASPGLMLAHLTYAAFPAAIGYGILRRNLFDIRHLARRASLYAALAAALAAVYFGAAAVAAQVLRPWLPGASGDPLLGFGAALAVAALFRPLHDRLRDWLDRLYLGERLEALRALPALSAEEGRSPDELAEDLAASIARAARPAWLAFRVGRDVSGATGPAPAEVVGALAAGAPEPTALDGLAGELGFAAVVPAGEATAALVLGPRAAGGPYAPDERVMLRALLAHGAMAIHRSRLIEERVRISVEARVAGELARARELVLRQVVHDLNTYLFNLKTLAALARREGGGEDLFSAVERGVARIEGLLREKLRWARHGRVRGSLGLHEALAAAADLMRPMLDERHQELRVHSPEADACLPLTLSEFEQVAANLIGNASRLTPEGCAVTLAAGAGEEGIWITVADEGPGLPAELIAGGASGPGLGLPNVIALVEGAGGRVTWGNAERGATIRLSWPREALPGAPGVKADNDS